MGGSDCVFFFASRAPGQDPVGQCLSGGLCQSGGRQELRSTAGGPTRSSLSRTSHASSLYRLHLGVENCQADYLSHQERVFAPPRHVSSNLPVVGHAQGSDDLLIPSGLC